MKTRHLRLVLVATAILLSLAAAPRYVFGDTVHAYELFVNGQSVGTERVTAKPGGEPPTIESIIVRTTGEAGARLQLTTTLDPATRRPVTHTIDDRTNRIAVSFGEGRLSLMREELASGQKTPGTIDVAGPALLVNFDSVAEYQVAIGAAIAQGEAPMTVRVLGLRRGNFNPIRMTVARMGSAAIEGVGEMTEWILYTPFHAARVWIDAGGAVYYVSAPMLGYEIVRAGGRRLAAAQLPGYVDTSRFIEVHTWLPGDLYDIPAIVTLPRQAGPQSPGVVLIQGIGARDADGAVGLSKPNRDLAWGLASQGVVSLRYAKRSYAYRDSINVARLTLDQDIVEDARRAIAELHRQTAVDRNRIYVAGWGLAGRLATHIAASADEKVAGVIAIDPPGRPLDEAILAQTLFVDRAAGADAEKLQRDADNIRNFMTQLRQGRAAEQALILGMGVPYWRGLLDSDPAKDLAGANFPVLTILPQRSFMTAEPDREIWQRLITEHKRKQPRSDVVAMPDLGHFLMHGQGRELPFMFGMGDAVNAGAVTKILEWMAGN